MKIYGKDKVPSYLSEIVDRIPDELFEYTVTREDKYNKYFERFPVGDNYFLMVIHYSKDNTKHRWTTRLRDVIRKKAHYVYEDIIDCYIVNQEVVDDISSNKCFLNRNQVDLLFRGFKYVEYTKEVRKNMPTTYQEEFYPKRYYNWIDSVVSLDFNQIDSIEAHYIKSTEVYVEDFNLW